MNTKINAVLFPLFLKLYDTMRPDLRGRLLPFVDQVRAFLQAQGVTVTDFGLIATPAEVRRAAAAAARADLVITLHLTYSPSLLVADTLQRLGKPILMLDTTKAGHFDETSMAADISENHGIHGVMDLASVLTGRRVPFEVVAGSLAHPEIAGRTKEVLRALKAVALFRDQRIGLTGRPFAGMGDFAVNFVELKKRFGATIKDVPISRIIAAGRRIPAAQVAAAVEADRVRYRLHQVDPEAHLAAVRDYLALSAIIAADGLSGYSMNFQHVRRGIATPFYACSRLLSDGIGYAGEGDVLTALLGRPLNFLSGEAFFSEMFCPDWWGGTLFMAHMGESDPRFARPGVQPVLAQKKPALSDRVSVYHLAELGEREVTLVNLARDAERGFRFVVAQADIVRFPLKVEFAMPHFRIKPRLPLENFLERYAYAGGGHHIYLATGDQRRPVALMARQLGLAFAEV
ncbi:MAG: hypothetical protein Q7S40_30590 [Opitutaceae bacterium]|nr:hypothetical protein [Opitutaceae bacterium]